jgi:hypothetical protein
MVGNLRLIKSIRSIHSVHSPTLRSEFTSQIYPTLLQIYKGYVPLITTYV